MLDAHMETAKLFLCLGGASAALAVAMGAFGAHGLATRVGVDQLNAYQTGAQYHFYHALGLIAVGLAISARGPSGWLRWSGWLLLAGTVAFSGSLYLIGLGAHRGFGLVTPFGGLAYITGWVLFAIGCWKQS